MRNAYALLFLAAVVGLSRGHNDVAKEEPPAPKEGQGMGSDLLEKLQALQPDVSAYNDMCAKQCPDNPKSFAEALNEVKLCAMSVDKAPETWCSYLRKSYMQCTQPMQTFLEECFTDEDTKYLPNHIFRAVLAGMDYLCDIDGEHLFELFNPCAHDMNYTSVCGRRLVSTYQQFDDTLPKRDELCGFMDSFKPCLTAHIKTSCPNEITQETWIGLYNAVASPCTDGEVSTEMYTNDK